jgi:hypothetical protein
VKTKSPHLTTSTQLPRRVSNGSTNVTSKGCPAWLDDPEKVSAVEMLNAELKDRPLTPGEQAERQALVRIAALREPLDALRRAVAQYLSFTGTFITLPDLYISRFRGSGARSLLNRATRQRHDDCVTTTPSAARRATKWDGVMQIWATPPARFGASERRWYKGNY